VVVEEDELAQITPRSSRVMEVLEFVPEAEVDPVYLEASYVAPSGPVRSLRGLSIKMATARACGP
jgi:non-homologous end joining protein Ku